MYAYVTFSSFIHWWTFRFSYFGFLNTIVRMRVQLSLWDPVMNYFGYIPRSGIAGSFGSFIFNFLRNFCTDFHSDSIILYLYQQCTWVLISPCPHPHLLSLFFWEKLGMPSIFSCVCWRFYVLFGEIPLQVLAPFLKFIIWFFVAEL